MKIMPILKYNHKILYFSHMPKCAGTSVMRIFSIISECKPSFYDPTFTEHNYDRWSFSSPQHILGKDVSKMFAPEFFDQYFAVCRDPIERFISAFLHQKYYEKKIPSYTNINEFINKISFLDGKEFQKYDNHFQPQSSFLFPDVRYTCFKLESGLKPVVDYLFNYFEVEKFPIKIPRENRMGKPKISENLLLTDASIAKLKRLYEKDYQIFRYQA